MVTVVVVSRDDNTVPPLTWTKRGEFLGQGGCRAAATTTPIEEGEGSSFHHVIILPILQCDLTPPHPFMEHGVLTQMGGLLA